MSELKIVGQQINSLRKVQFEMGQIEKQIAARNEEISKLETSMCPTCERQWDEANKRIALLREENEAAADTWKRAKAMLAQLPGLEQQQTELGSFQPDPMIEKLGEVKSKVMGELQSAQVAVAGQRQAAEIKRQRQVLEVTQRFQSAIETHQKAVNVAQDAEFDARGVLFQAKTALKAAEDSNARESQRAKVAKERLAEASAHLADIEQRASAYKVQIQAEQDFIKVVGKDGFLGRIFDEVLDEISAEANQVLAGLPNAQHVTIRFASESITQKGTVKKSIVPMVSFGGVEAPLKSGCSGGMLTSVELAVDLAVSSVVSRRAGIVPGWLVLDEAFEGLDLVSKESGMTILSQYGQDRLVLVVDHATEFKEMFTQFVNVELRNGVSSV
jgi:DNA repair exonuclease SbcCD ATPase subunit